jgi:tetratricopeptide (TPR) repeat protein
VAEAKAAVERWARRLTAGLAALALLVAAGGGGVYSWWRQQSMAQAAELAQRQRETDEAARLAMGQARLLLEQARAAPLAETGRYDLALAAAQKGEELARAGEASEEVRGQAEELLRELEGERQVAARDQRLVAQLLDVRLPRETPVFRPGERGTVVELDGPSADEQFGAAFRAWGLDVDGTPAAEAAARLQARPAPVLTEVVAALDEWAAERRQQQPPGDWRRLQDLAEILDGDPHRTELRAILARGRLLAERALAALSGTMLPLAGPLAGTDRTRLRALAGQMDTAGEPALGVVLLARALQTAGDDLRAEEVLRSALRRRPGEVVLLHALGRLLAARRPPRWAGALECYTAARAVRPQLGVTLARALEEAGRAAEGAVILEEMARQEPANPALPYHLGYVLYAQRDYKGAEACYRRVIELKPDHFKSHHNLGTALHAQERYAEAEAACRRAIDLNPQYSQAFSTLSLALSAQGRHAEAAEACRRAIDLRPESVQTLIVLGNALYRLRQYAEAETAYRRVIDLKPDYPEAHYNLGLALDAQNHSKEAEAAYRRAIDLRPEYPKAFFSLGDLLRRRNRFAEAEAAYRQAIHLKPDDHETHYNLGIALQLQCEFTEAIVVFRKVLSMAPPGPARDQAEARIRRCQELIALDEKLAAILKGEYTPADAREQLGLAGLCQWYKNRTLMAACFYAAAFATEPKLAEDMPRKFREYAACAAVLAAAGQGVDAGNLSSPERAKWRRQALDWLGADLAEYTRRINDGPPQARQQALNSLRSWQQDSDLDTVRNRDELAKLPEAERHEWQRFWSTVHKYSGP